MKNSNSNPTYTEKFAATGLLCAVAYYIKPTLAFMGGFGAAAFYLGVLAGKKLSPDEIAEREKMKKNVTRVITKYLQVEKENETLKELLEKNSSFSEKGTFGAENKKNRSKSETDLSKSRFEK
ncbi:MAG: hypothetical protein QNK11_00540 [Legionella sp.]|nr:hypothetical protein [Legionella sp.]